MPWKPDPTFYPSPRSAAAAPPEELAYVVTLNTGTNGDRRPDALEVIDLQAGSSSYGTRVGRLDMPNVGDELHHFGWNACSSALCPCAPHPMSSDATCSYPASAHRASTWSTRSTTPGSPRWSRSSSPRSSVADGLLPPHTIHCGPDGIYVSALGRRTAAAREASSSSIRRLRLRGRWELDRGPQELAYDVWWHIGLGHHGDQRWGIAQHGRRRASIPSSCSRASMEATARVGSAAPPPRAGARSGRRAADGAGTAARPRSDQAVRLRRRRLSRRICLRDLAVASWHREEARQRIERRVGVKSDRGAGRAGRRRRSSRRALKRFGAVAAAGHRYRPVARRPLSVRVVLGDRRVKRYDVSDPANPRRWARSGSAASCAAPHIRRRARSTVVRRWSRSAATAGAST